MYIVGKRGLLVVFLFLSAVYVGLTFGIPPDAATLNKYSLDNAQIQLLRLTLVVPIVAIWMTAYYGIMKFNKYYQTINSGREEHGWSYLVKGLLVLGLYLPLNTISTSIGGYFYHKNHSLTSAIIIATNYFTLALVLAAFILLYMGARTLAKSTRKALPERMYVATTLFLLVVSSIFTHLTLSNANRSVEVSSTVPAAYYLPDWLLVITIIIPYIAIFYLGTRIALYLYAYRINVKGAIYKSAIKYLANGIGAAVISVMVLRYFASMSSLLDKAQLGGLLLIIYILIIIIAVGYVLIALGAKKLQRIEEV